MNLAADYSMTDDKPNNADIAQYNVAAVFAVASTTDVAVGMGNVDDDNEADDVTEWYANVTYKFPEAKNRSEEHTSELQSRPHLVCRLLLEKKKKNKINKSNVNK